VKLPQWIGGSYESQSILADCERTINWYPELLQAQGATAKTVLYPTPGVTTLGTMDQVPGRAHFYMDGREFAVSGTNFVEIDSLGTAIYRGTVALDSNPATISSNGDLGGQLFITSGGNGYYYTLSTNVLTQITALNGIATMGAHLEGYFLALDAASSTLYISALGDGSSWTTGTDFAQRNFAPDPWVSMKVSGRYIWLFGELTTEVWYNSGDTFPFSAHPSGALGFGIAAPWSAQVVNEAIIWLAVNSAGKRCFVRAQEFSPAVISTYPLETVLKGYQSIETAVADSYSDQGHSFYLISFDRDDITWAWDDETKLWAERGTWVTGLGRYTSWRPRYHAFAFGQHRMLDAVSDEIYQLSNTVYTDVGGDNIRRLRRAPAISEELKDLFFSSFELDVEVGLDTLPLYRYEYLAFTVTKPAESRVMTFDAALTTASSNQVITSYDWTFGDGGTETGENPAHEYLADATYTVTMTMTYDDGSTATLTASVICAWAGVTSQFFEDNVAVLDTEGRDAQVMLRWSNDGGKTWGNEHWRGAGKTGEYNKRLIWRRLGVARRRVFEVVVTDPIPWRIMGAYIDAHLQNG
jgi:PKD repeat protein